MGVIGRFPGGRRPTARPRAVKSEAKVVEQASAVVANQRAEVSVAPVPPWQEQTHAERLNTLTGKALDKTRDILDLPCDPDNLKLLAIQKDAALSVLSTQVKVDETRLRQREHGNSILDKLWREIKEETAVRGGVQSDEAPLQPIEE